MRTACSRQVLNMAFCGQWAGANWRETHDDGTTPTLHKELAGQLFGAHQRYTSAAISLEASLAPASAPALSPSTPPQPPPSPPHPHPHPHPHHNPHPHRIITLTFTLTFFAARSARLTQERAARPSTGCAATRCRRTRARRTCSTRWRARTSSVRPSSTSRTSKYSCQWKNE